MRRLAITLFTVLATAALSPGTAHAATDEVQFCGKRNGWQVAGGNLPPELPLTDCAFAQTTFTTVTNRPGKLTKLKKRFSVTVGGFALTCTARSPKGYAEFRCRDATHFVLAYRFF